jgi:hypothetical protein
MLRALRRWGVKWLRTPPPSQVQAAVHGGVRQGTGVERGEVSGVGTPAGTPDDAVTA